MSRKLIQITGTRNFKLLSRLWNGQQTTVVHSESQIKSVLSEKFPKAKEITVSDVSGGCGAMFDVTIESQDFKGLPTVKQHRLITEALKDQIKDMHGIRIHTAVPDS